MLNPRNSVLSTDQLVRSNKLFRQFSMANGVNMI